MTTLSAIMRQRFGELESAAPQIRAVLEAVGDPANLTFGQALLLYAVTLDLAPDVILDLGTGKGNSAAIFALASSKLSKPRPEILTFDLVPSWDETLRLRLNGFRFLGDWVSPVVGDLTRFAFAEKLKQANSVVIFWDAHGFDVAETMLTRVLPALRHKRNIILCHDIGDARYARERFSSYGGLPLWRGMTHYYEREETAPVRIGNFMGVVDQLIAILDFCSRNDISLNSCDYDLDTGMDGDEKRRWAAQCGSDPQTYMSYFSMINRPHYHLPRAHLIEEQWTQIYGAPGHDLGYNIGASLSESDGLPLLTVSDGNQHLASFWIALEPGRSIKLEVRVDWPDGKGARAPIYLQGENYQQIGAVEGATSGIIDGGAAGLPSKIRLVIHPRQPGTYVLPRAVEIVAMHRAAV